MPAIGTCFQLIPEGDNHIWIVISKPLDGRVLCVNITDAERCLDSPCQFERDEHCTIEKRSAVIYRKARTFEAVKVDAELAWGKFVRQFPPYSDALVKRIVEGAKQATDLTGKFLKYLI